MAPAFRRTSAVYVCLCNGVTDRHIREAVDKGCSSVGELTMRTGCGANCGSCLEMAAEIPTPAEHMSARRMLQLQLLTKRNDPAPAQTWTQDAAKVWSSGFDAGTARRLQTVLKVLMKK